ncbi:hypothetical protein BB560_001684 [Smittium megazygosporum]|uniref:Uncharacterized protein n=1 Tax=Smittium megazygosporum TaxID=133381 RepID=A0A2T9ZGU7_9FUNG|nr:hypothetical protein BB560_001684 [Smittium megazygosporum]
MLATLNDFSISDDIRKLIVHKDYILDCEIINNKKYILDIASLNSNFSRRRDIFLSIFKDNPSFLTKVQFYFNNHSVANTIISLLNESLLKNNGLIFTSPGKYKNTIYWLKSKPTLDVIIRNNSSYVPNNSTLTKVVINLKLYILVSYSSIY